ncbi:type IV secretion system protein [Bradyrhizobium sp. LA7.1]|uniref:type IV secretion system protein n=1 Tax=Bradyrhizobium sp. LA7.1 TaxID=3156324 RepID=UPI003392E831
MTRAEAWLRQLANFVILLVLVVALVGLILTAIGGFIDRFGANAGTAGELVVAIQRGTGYIAPQLPTIAGGVAGGGASLASRLVTSPLVANATAAAGGAHAGIRWSASRGLAAVKANCRGCSMRRVRSQATTTA